jgi:protein gp37
MAKRFPNMKRRYSGPPRLIPEELEVNYGKGRTIFLEHMNDLFAEGVRATDKILVLEHAREYPENSYVFQTKDPAMARVFNRFFEPGWMIGTTIEADEIPAEIRGAAPSASSRAFAMADWMRHAPDVKRFVTVEPILDFNPLQLATLVLMCQPDFVNIGADSKGTGLPEPSWEKVVRFLTIIEREGVEIRRKSNLERLIS